MLTPSDGLDFLTRCEWLPSACEPARAVSAMQAGALDAVWDNARHAPCTRLPVVERLAVAFALLRAYPNAMDAPAGIHSAIERLGLEVSPDFAEQGSRACGLLLTIAALERGETVALLSIEEAAAGLGALWETAFEAPAGFAHYITRSLMGRVPNGWGFLALPDIPLHGAALAARLRFGVDLLHAAIALHEQPSINWPDDPAAIPDWRAPVAAIESGRGARHAGALTIHVRTLGVGEDPVVQHVSVWLGYPGEHLPVAWVHGTVLTGSTGTVEEFVELVDANEPSNPLLDPREVVTAEVRRQIHSVFANPDVVSLYPRVRRLLDRSEHRVHRLLVIEHMGIAPAWRGRSLGQRLVQQLLMESGDVEIVLGRPQVMLPEALQASGALGVRAAAAMATLRQAHAWSTFGGEFLINGVMGLALPQIQMARVNALWERQPTI